MAYKRVILLIIIPTLVLLSACPPGTDDPGTGNPDNGNTAGSIEAVPGDPITVAATLWGTWLRLDKAESYYFSNTDLTVTDAEGNETTAVYTLNADNRLQFPDIAQIADTDSSKPLIFGRVPGSDNTLQLQIITGETVTKVVYLQKMSGLKGMLTGTAVEQIETAAGQSRALGLGSLGGIKVIATNLKNAEDSHEAVTGQDGSFEFDAVIPEDEYELSIPSKEVAAVVGIKELVENIGTLTAPETDYNFKASYRVTDYPNQAQYGLLDTTIRGAYMYARSSEDEDAALYGITVAIENIGTAAASDLTYEIAFPETMELIPDQTAGTAGTTGTITSLAAGAEHPLYYQIRRSAIMTESLDYIEESAEVTLTDDAGNLWQDSLSLRFYRRELKIEIAKIHSLPMQGTILSPDERAQATWFEGADETSTDFFIVDYIVPQRGEGYTMRILPAYEGAVRYGITLDEAPMLNHIGEISDAFDDEHEPNDSEETATVLYNSPFNFVHGIIEPGDIDYFHILPYIAPAVDETPPGEVTALEADVYDARIELKWSNPTDEDFVELRLRLSGDGESDTEYLDKTDTTFSVSQINRRKLRNGVSYEFTLTALDNSGNESAAASITAVPVLADPGATAYALSSSFAVPFDIEDPLHAVPPNVSDIETDDDGRIYLLEQNQHRIMQFDADGSLLAMWGKNSGPDPLPGGGSAYGTGDGEFYSPQGFVRSANGSFYIADSGNHRIQVLDASGAFVAKWGADDGSGASGNGPGEFDYPGGICLDSSGNIWVTDTGNHRIQQFTADGTFLAAWVNPDEGDNAWESPGRIVFHPAANRLILSRFDYHNTLAIFTSEMLFAENLIDNDHPFRCSDLAVGPAGHVFLCGTRDEDWNGNDQTNIETVKKVSIAQTPIAEITFLEAGVAELQDLTAVHIDTAGLVYVADSQAKTIFIFVPEE